jgi:Uma2 family endonuclease
MARMGMVKPRVSYADLERMPEDGRRYELYDGEVSVVPAPDLAIEVLSPSTASNDRGRKMRMFQRYRVTEYWIVDPMGETIEIYALGDADYTLTKSVSGAGQVTSAIAPGLAFTASVIFP